jgi:hypothetical protein
MASFSAYLAPTVTTSVIYEQGGVTLFGSTVIPVLIGEGQETRTYTGVELIRGSSAVAANLVTNESLTGQVTGTTSTFILANVPTTSGGVVTNDVTQVTVYTLDSQANQIPLQVTSLVGATRTLQLGTLLQAGSPLYASYQFQRSDTLLSNQDISVQVPAFASLTFQGITLGLSQPGFGGNSVTLQLTLAAINHGVPDLVAVSGNGSNVISIELRRPDNTVRDSYTLLSLIQAGISTASSGMLTYVAPLTGADITLSVLSATAFSGGSGQSTNTTFKLPQVPVVDGTNGGIVTNLPSMVTVTVNNVAVPVVSLNGSTGYFTLASGVAYGSRMLATYHTNTYPDTFDLLPYSGVTAALNVGYAPGRNDFVAGTDFILGSDGDIHWGNASLLNPGIASSGYVPFNATAVSTTLVDEKMHLRPCTGQVNGVNAVFTLADLPVDGSGLGVSTDNPLLVQVYVGTTPVLAYDAGPVTLAQLSGASGQITLYNPPTSGNVYATYWRNTMGNHTFTETVLTAGAAGVGSYQIQDESGNIAPTLIPGVCTISQAAAAATGLIWPASKSDLRGIMGRTPTETVTLTFQADTISVVAPAVPAVNTTALPGVIFTAVTTGVAPNAVNPAIPLTTEPQVLLTSGTACADSAAITVALEVISININSTNSSMPTRTLADIVSLVNAQSLTANDTSNKLGGLTASLETGWVGTTLAVAGYPTGFYGGATAVTNSASTHFKVTSSRTAANSYADNLGITGGATTNAGSPTLGADGWLNQTYVDPNTGVAFTLVDPSLAFDNAANPTYASDYGFTTTITPQWQFLPGDKVTFTVTGHGVQIASVTPSPAIYGMQVALPSTYGMNIGDTLLIQTHDRAGSEPAVGNYYYADLVVAKSATELATVHYYTSPTAVATDMGAAVPLNKASLGSSLMFANGANLVAVLQVPKQTGLTTASDASYTNAIASLRKALPIAGHKANVIIPMTTDQPVLSYLATHLATQASPRNKGEALGFVGLPLTGTAAQASALAQALNSERMILVYPGGATVQVQQNNVGVNYAVGGEFLAAALAGLFLNSSNDVATDLSLQLLTGFQNLISQTEEPVMDLMASNGVTVLVQTPAGIQIRQYVTTSTGSVLLMEPYVTSSIDAVRQATRTDLQQFIAKKNIQSRLTDIAVAVNGRMGNFVSAEILGGAQPAIVTPSATDQRVVNVTVPVQPMFSTLWINVTFIVTATNTPAGSNS